MEPITALLVSLLLSACATTAIEDNTEGEHPVRPPPEQTRTTYTHSHVPPYYIARRSMCDAIRNASETIEGFHPVYALGIFPSAYPSPLAWQYNHYLSPTENLEQKLKSGFVYGGAQHKNGIRGSYVFRHCFTPEQKILAESYLDIVKVCNAGNYVSRNEYRTHGTVTVGDNGRDCEALEDQVIKVHLQGYKPSLGDAFSDIGSRLTFGYAKTGFSSSIVKAYDKCIATDKAFNMEYLDTDEKLVFSCIE